MTSMVRKQIYISDHQDSLVKRLAKIRGTSEAEVIRQALDREISGRVDQVFTPDADALHDLIEAALSRRDLGTTGAPYRWRREDAYEERLSRYGRQSGLASGSAQSTETT